MPLDFDKADYSIFDEEDEEQPQQDMLLSTTIEQARKQDPQQHASNLQLATESGMPVDAVATDSESVRFQLDFDKADYGNLTSRSPKTGAFLSNYDDAVVAQEDISLFERIEETFKGLGESLKEVPGQTFKSGKLLLLDTVQKFTRGIAESSGVTVAGDEESNALKTVLSDVDSYLSGEQGRLISEIEEVVGRREELTPEDLNILQQGVRGGVESLATQAPGFAAFLLTRNPNMMLGFIGAQTGLSSYGDARAEGLAAQEAGDFAAREAFIEVATEMIPVKALEKILTGTGTGKVGRDVLNFMLREVGTEQIATLGQSLNAYQFGLDEQLQNATTAGEVTNIMLERAAVTAIATVVAGGAQAGITAGVAKTIERVSEGEQAQEAVTNREQEVLQEMNDVADSSRLRQTSPETLGRFMQQVNDGEDVDVYLDSAQAALYLQENADNIENDGTLLYLAEKVQQSSNTGEDITIPADEFMTTIAGSEHFEPLHDSMTLNQESVAPFRQEQAKQETESYVRNLVQQADDKISDDAESLEIFEQVRSQLIDTGRVEPSAANTMAKLVSSSMAVFAERNGITVREAYERGGLDIVGPQTGQAAALEEERRTLGQRARQTFDSVRDFITGQGVPDGQILDQPIYTGGVSGQQVIDHVRQNGGITVTRSGQIWEGDSGYIASVRSMNVPTLEQAIPLLKATLNSLEGVGRDDLVAGIFPRGEGGFSVDTNLVTEDRVQAEQIGRDFDQEAIYDVAANADIDTGGAGEGATEEKFQQFLSQPTPQINDDGAGPDGQLERPPVTDGEVVLDHFSTVRGIETLDPSKFGTGIRASESRRATQEFWVDRTNYGIATGQPGGYRKERALGNEHYQVKIPFDQLYDIQNDPDNLRADLSQASNPGERVNLYERKIKDAGYAGYWQKHPSLGLVAVTFEPQNVQGAQGSTYSQPPVYEHEAKTQAEFGRFLDQLVQERFDGPLSQRTPENKDIISSAIVDEILDEMGADSAAATWYKDSINNALANAANIHPEIASDQNARQVFIMSLALTSNGATIARNVENAEAIYTNWKETGQFDTSAGTGFGTRGPNIQAAFDKFSALVNELGLQETFDFLNGQYTVRELNEAGYNITGENKDTVVFGSSIFGPKIGGAFFQNLRGNWDALTMDQWFMKTWGRLTGTMLDKKGQVLSTPANGSERQWIREVVREAQDKLRDRGHNMDIATMQALLWYREKDLYIGNNVANLQAEGTDYEQEFEKLAVRKLNRRTSTVGDRSDANQARLTARERSEVRRNQGTRVLSFQSPGRTVQGDQQGDAQSTEQERAGEQADELTLQQEDRGSFDTESTTIRLTEASDLSTFLHEFAHFMYEQEMKFDGSLLPSMNNWFRGNAGAIAFEASTIAEQRGDLQHSTSDEVITFIDEGTTGNETKDKDIQRAMHEQFARGFETYLMEGRSPSSEMRGVFATISRWLVDVYQAIRGNLNIQMTDQMREVFDRLLATDEQIEFAKARARFQPLFTDATMAGMTESEFKSYQERQQRAADRDEEELRTKLIRQLRRKTKRWWRDERQDIIDQVTPDLKETRVYRTTDQLRHGEVKLDLAAVKEMVGQEVTNKQGTTFIRVPPKLNNMTAPGGVGIHPDEAAGMFGYNSGAEMLDEIIHAQTINKAAQKLAEAQMVERHGDILNDGTIEQEADRAIKNEEHGKLLLTELNTLTRETSVPRMERQLIKDIAARQIGQQSFRNLNPTKYRKAEIKAAQEAAVALENGDKTTAAEAKTRQVMNFYLGQEAQNARDETMKIVDRMGRYRLKRVQAEIMKAGSEYWEQLEKILERFEFRKSATLASAPGQLTPLFQWVKDRIENDGDDIEITPEVLDQEFRVHWKNVPHGALVGVADSIRNIEHAAKYSNKITLTGESTEFDKLRNQWVDHMAQRNPDRFSAQRTTVVEGRKWGQWSMAQMSKIPWVASWLDGGQRVGLSHQLLVQPMTDALAQEFNLQEQALKPVVDAMNNRSRADIRRHNTKLFIPEIQDEENDGNLMGHQILAVALNVGNQSNLRKLLLGEGWANPENEAEITIENPKLQAVLKHMSESDWNLVQLIWDQMDSLYPQLAEVKRRSSGIVPPKIESTPVSTPFGEFRGGYYPIKYDPNRSERARENEERLQANVDSMFSSDGSMHSVVTAAATNERTGFFDPIRLSLDIVPNHFQEVIHYITHHDAVRQVNKLIRDKRVAKVIKEKLGPEEYAQLKPWLNDIAKDGRDNPNKTFIEDVLGRLRFGLTLGIMGFKASTGLIQISGLSNTAAEVGVLNLAKVVPEVGKDVFVRAFRKVMRSPKSIEDSWTFALENSKVLAHRVRTMDREMRKVFNDINDPSSAIAKSGVGEVMRKIGRALNPKWARAIQQASLKHIAYIQLYSVDLPSWHAAYSKKLAETGSEKEAFQYADFVIEQVQGSGNVKDQAAVLRNQSEAVRSMTMFMTFFSSLWNAQRDTARGARGGQYSTTAVAAKLMFLITVPVLFEMLMRGDLFDGDDELDKEKLATNIALFPLQSVPFLRDAASGAIGDYGYNISPAASLLERGIQAAPELLKRPLTDKEITASQVEGTAKLVGAFLGTPGINQAWATGEHLFEVLERGEELTAREFLFGPDRE